MIREQVYIIKEAARLLEINRATIRRWIKAGKLDSENIGGVVLLQKQQIDSIRRQRGRVHTAL